MKLLSFKIPLLLLLTLSLCYCSSTDSGGNIRPLAPEPHQPDILKDVTYSIDCGKGVTCNNPTYISDVFTAGQTKLMTCLWSCGNYKGNNRYDVFLSFEKPNNECWRLESESLSKDGHCR
jgi:hypothetical protein